MFPPSHSHTSHHTWCTLCSSVSLLTVSGLSHTSTVPLAEQLLYLARGEQALGDLDQLQRGLSPPPAPQEVSIPDHLWETLHKIPLSLDYYGAVLGSLKTHPQFWEGVVEGVVKGGASVGDFSVFPWRGEVVGVGLDDYVMLRCLDEQSFVAKVSGLMEKLMESISVPLLGDVVATPSGPVLLFYEEACPRSQVLLSRLEQGITDTLRVCVCLGKF